MFFKLVGQVLDIETIASGTTIREIGYAEVHWYQAHGVGKRELKIKRILKVQ